MPVKQVVVIRRELNMRKGKIAAQVAHVTSKLISEHILWPTKVLAGWEVNVRMDNAAMEWFTNGKFTKIVAWVQTEAELIALRDKAKNLGLPVYDIIDAGMTEFGGTPTRTCVGFGPAPSELLDPITGHLPLC